VLGALAALEGRFEDARALCSQAHDLYEAIGASRAVNFLWPSCMLVVHRRTGELEAAIRMARETIEYFERQGERAYASTWAARLAELLYSEGRIEEASRAVTEARAVAIDHDVYVQFLWRSTAAKLAARADSAEEAERLSSDALRLAAACDSPLLLADLWVARAEVLQVGGRHAEAAEAAERARTQLREKGDSTGLAELERQLSRTQTKSPSGLSV